MVAGLDIIARDYVAPLASAHGFTREGRVFRLDGEQGSSCLLHVRTGRSADRAITSFLVEGVITTREWTAWINRELAEPKKLSPAGGGLSVWPLVPPLEFWYTEVYDRLHDYPYGPHFDDETRRDGAWAFEDSEESLQACGQAVALALEEQSYIENVVAMLDRPTLRSVLAERDGTAYIQSGRGLHYMLQVSAAPRNVEALLASAVPPLPDEMANWIRDNCVS